MKIELDKYYTSRELAMHCITKTFDIIGIENVTEVVEPSAGNGAFSRQIYGCLAYDIEPDSEYVEKADFLSLKMEYKKGRLFIGNPPFGNRNHLLRKFYVKCCNIGDYISFIMPISQLNSSLQLFEFDLIYSEDLGIKTYSDIALHCCLNVYRRPVSGLFNERPNYKLNEIEIIEHRRHSDKTCIHKDIKSGFFYSMCNWGNSCLGNVPKYIGEYAQEVYFYCDNKDLQKKVIEQMEYDKIRAYASSISSKKLSVMSIYKYLYENIQGLSLKPKTHQLKIL